MKKKIILISFCLILFLIFTALSYAKPDPKYIFQGHPWDDLCLSSPNDITEANILVFSITHNITLIFSVNKSISLEKNFSQSNAEKEKWINTLKKSPKRLPQR